MIEPSVHPTRSEYKRQRRELARQVLELYASGRTVLDIAAELQIPVGRASRLLGHALAAIHSLPMDHYARAYARGNFRN